MHTAESPFSNMAVKNHISLSQIDCFHAILVDANRQSSSLRRDEGNVLVAATVYVINGAAPLATTFAFHSLSFHNICCILSFSQATYQFARLRLRKGIDVSILKWDWAWTTRNDQERPERSCRRLGISTAGSQADGYATNLWTYT